MLSSLLLLLLCENYLVVAAYIGKPTNLALPLLPPLKSSDKEGYCVSGSQWPDWDGAIDLPSCTDAVKAMIARVPPVTKHPWFFWSGKTDDEPPVPWPWRLPEHTNAGGYCVHLRPRYPTL